MGTTIEFFTDAGCSEAHPPVYLRGAPGVGLRGHFDALVSRRCSGTAFPGSIGWGCDVEEMTRMRMTAVS